MTKIKLKKKPIFIAVAILIGIIVVVSAGVKIKKDLDYKKTYEYRLEQMEYSKEDVAMLIEKLSNKELDKILELEYYDIIPKLVKQKYYLHKNLDKYLEYHEKNNCVKDNMDCFKDIIAIINVGANKEWYTGFIRADTSKGNLMLINKFHKLDESYSPDDLANVLNWYAYGNDPKLKEEAYESFISMYNAAKEDKMNIYMNSPYRTFQHQEKLYNDYKLWYGQESADTYSARPGFSEHQTGLAIDIGTYGATMNTFDSFPESQWLQENAHKFGFILRYPKEKEFLTGYIYEPWHYRYVGKDVAAYIHKNKITFDEYYAFYIEG